MIVLAFSAHCDKLIADSLKSVINFSDSSNTRTGSRDQMSNYIQIHHGTKFTSRESKEVKRSCWREISDIQLTAKRNTIRAREKL